jgi:hypothetical protein
MAVPPFLAGIPPAGFRHPKGCHRLFPISTPFDHTSMLEFAMQRTYVDKHAAKHSIHITKRRKNLLRTWKRRF